MACTIQNKVMFADKKSTERPGHPNPSSTRLGFYEEYHPELYKDTEFLTRFIAAQKWIFARTMPQCPHWYVVRGKGPIEEEFGLFRKVLS